MKNKGIKLKFLVLVLVLAMVVSVLPVTCNKHISYAATIFKPFIPNKPETVKIFDDNSDALISLEQARAIIEDLYPGLLYQYNCCFERENGEKYYIIKLKERVDNHTTTLSQYFISFDGKVCIEGYIAGSSSIVAYNNTNFITVRKDALKAYNEMLSADMMTFYTDYYSEETHITNIEIDPSNPSCKFAILYVDGDRIPELIVYGGEGTSHGTGSYNLFTYRNGKVEFIYNTQDDFTYYEKTGIFSWNHTGMGESIYKYYDIIDYYIFGKVDSNAVIATKDYLDLDCDKGVYNKLIYKDSNENEISEIDFQKLLVNYINNKDIQNGLTIPEEQSPVFYKNTIENRDKYLIPNEESKHQKSIAVFTTNKSMKVKTGKSISLGFGLLDKNSGLVDDKWKKMSVVVSNPTVIGLSDYTEMEYGYSIEITGKKQGATNIAITDTETGINTIITISVQDDYVDTYSYAIDNIAHFYPNNNFEKDIETNIYNLNGLYVNKYQCTKSTNSYNVSFDVYNSKYYSGAVDIYDENGMWTGYEEIEKYSDISSLWNTIEQTWYLVSDTVAGKMLTYEQASYSKHTHIDIEVPEGGYFTISNNVSESPGTFFINAFEILFNGVSAVSDFLTDGIEDSALTKLKKEAKKTFATRLIEARNEGLKDNVKRTSQKIMLDSMKSKIKDIAKENIKTGLKDKLKSTNIMCSNIANLVEDMLAPHSFNIEWKSVLESATGIGESFFTKFAGPAGIALEGCFTLNDSANMILMTTQMAESVENPYVTIFSSIDTGYINPYGVIVNTNGNIDAESVLQVFRISNNDVIEVLLDSNNPFQNYELYNICFVKDDKLVQPNGKVTVQIPVPKGMKGNTCKVYRQEQGGAWTIIDAKVQGNYLVFETEHFSLYAVIGENDNLVISSLPKKINYKNGEILDTDGLVLDLNGKLITEGYICEPTVLSGNGKQFIKVIYGHSVAEFEVNVDKTEFSSVSPSPASVVIPTPVPSPSQSPTATPVVTIVPDKTPIPVIVPEPTSTPTVIQEPAKEPEATPAHSASPVTEENNNTSSPAKLKKGSKIRDKRTKAVYKITSTGKNKTAEYVKSTKNNTTDIFIPASVKLKGKTFKVVSVGKGAFKNNKKLKSVKIGKNIKVINKEAFSGCKKLEKVKMGRNVTSIGKKAFNNCTSLRIITIPSKVKKIGAKAFYQCKNLRYILVKTKKLKQGNIDNNAFGKGYSNPRVKTDKSVWKQYQAAFTAKGLSGKALFIINPVKLIV